MEAIGILQFPVIPFREAKTPPAEPKGSGHGWVAGLMRTEGAGILRLLHRLLRNEADVLDAFQDCFCKLAGRGDRGDLISARAYAYRTATNIAIEMLRAKKRRTAHMPAMAECATQHRTQSAQPVAAAAPRASVHALQGAIANLPPHLRGVIVLRDLSGMSYQDVGRVLGIDPATARVYRRHAVVKLAETMGSEPE